MRRLVILALVCLSSPLAAQPEIEWSIAFNRGSTSGMIGAVHALDDEHVLIAGNGDAYTVGFDEKKIPYTKIYTASESLLDNSGVFIGKVNTTTNSIVFLTHIVTSDGGLFNSSVFDMDVDEVGNIYMVGLVDKFVPNDGDILPITDRLEGHVDGYRSEVDGLFVKLDAHGDLLLASYFGGEGAEVPYRIKALGNNRFAIAGTTSSEDFLLRNSIVGEMRGENDGFVQVYEEDNTLSFSSLLGGEFDDHATALDYSDNKLVIAGKTNSPDFPVTANAMLPHLQGDYDGWLVEIALDTLLQVYGSYYGSQNYNDIQSAEFLNNDLYIAGTSVIDGYVAGTGEAVDETGVYYKKLDSSYSRTLAGSFYHGQTDATIYANYLAVSEGRVAVVGGLHAAFDEHFPVVNRLSELNDWTWRAGRHTGVLPHNGGFVIVWEPDSEVFTATQTTTTSGFGGTVYSADFMNKDMLLIGGSTGSMEYIDRTYSYRQDIYTSIAGDYALSIDLSGPKNELPIAVNDVVELTVNADHHPFSPLANDSDPDGEFDMSIWGTFGFIEGPDNGSVYYDEGGNWTYKPDRDFRGTDIGRYMIRDAAGAIAYATVTFKVRDLPPGPGPTYIPPPPSISGGGSSSLFTLLLLGLVAGHRRRSLAL